MVGPGRVALTAFALITIGAGAGCDDELRCSGPFVTLRNPTTLACVQRQLASEDCPDIPASPPWPACKHPCEAIANEATCAATPGCRVTRELCDVFDDRCERDGAFIACFPIGTAEAPAGDCTTLGASACATRDDCGGQYLHGPDCPDTRGLFDGPACRFSFVTCFDERAPP